MIDVSVNPLSGQSLARQPKGSVSVNGIYISWESFEIETNTYYVADTFRVDIVANLLPVNLTPNIMSNLSEMLVNISAGFPSSSDTLTNAGLSNIFYGQVDDFTYDPLEGTITLSGRDLSSKFIDNKTTEKFVNLTSSQIAILLAKRRGLKPIVTATTTKVGRYYAIDHSRLTNESSEWDLLTYLAREENFVVYVKGQNLYFQPAPVATQLPYVINANLFNNIPSTNVVDLKLSRNLTLAKDVIVKVQSWNQKGGKAFTKTAMATHKKSTVLKGAAQPIGDAQVYTYTFANLTPQQALQKAQQLLQEISKHEMRLTATMPADIILDKSQIIKLTNTGTLFDQIYYPDSVVRKMSMEEGFTMTVNAKNHSPNTQTLV